MTCTYESYYSIVISEKICLFWYNKSKQMSYSEYPNRKIINKIELKELLKAGTLF